MGGKTSLTPKIVFNYGFHYKWLISDFIRDSEMPFETLSKNVDKNLHLNRKDWWLFCGLSRGIVFNKHKSVFEFEWAFVGVASYKNKKQLFSVKMKQADNSTRINFVIIISLNKNKNEYKILKRHKILIYTYLWKKSLNERE